MKKKIILILLILSAIAEARCYIGYVTGLPKFGDNFLAVRTGPTTKSSIKDSLHNSDEVIICDYSHRWLYIYYGDSCYIKYGEPRGYCKTGWVYGKYIK